jgi:ribosomal protein S13
MRNHTIAKNKLVRYTLAAVLGAGSVASQAACKQADVAGTWLVSGLSATNAGSFTTFCKLKVSKSGAFGNSNSTCESSLGPTSVSGSMKISGKTCSIKAFPMKVFVNGVESFTFTVDFMAMDKGKTTFTATGNKDVATTGLAQFIWQGVKQ